MTRPTIVRPVAFVVLSSLLGPPVGGLLFVIPVLARLAGNAGDVALPPALDQQAVIGLGLLMLFITLASYVFGFLPALLTSVLVLVLQHFSVARSGLIAVTLAAASSYAFMRVLAASAPTFDKGPALQIVVPGVAAIAAGLIWLIARRVGFIAPADL